MSPNSPLATTPRIAYVAAAIDDRRCKNHLTLGNGKTLPEMGLSPATHANRTFNIVAGLQPMTLCWILQ
ncbi:hypothetical protein Vadar_017691 [Vaccinium darrowii]|uniref:Uncharacterized protein n=1 Tax=Vaccinium darrowii TaxID=229202 RepID=A0ACB7XRM8_9ERIC|nr:hypothetical protein Vadar_017691 [Vaccinium darrowii]